MDRTRGRLVVGEVEEAEGGRASEKSERRKEGEAQLVSPRPATGARSRARALRRGRMTL